MNGACWACYYLVPDVGGLFLRHSWSFPHNQRGLCFQLSSSNKSSNMMEHDGLSVSLLSPPASSRLQFKRRDKKEGKGGNRTKFSLLSTKDVCSLGNSVYDFFFFLFLGSWIKTRGSSIHETFSTHRLHPYSLNCCCCCLNQAGICKLSQDYLFIPDIKWKVKVTTVTICGIVLCAWD